MACKTYDIYYIVLYKKITTSWSRTTTCLIKQMVLKMRPTFIFC